MIGFDPSSFIAAEEAKGIAPSLDQSESMPAPVTGFITTGGEGAFLETRPPAAPVPDITYALRPADAKPILSRARTAPAAPVDITGYRAGLRHLATLPDPAFMAQVDWRRLVSDAQAFGRLSADQALGLGWTLLDVFGCPPRPWERRMDPCGLVFLLAGRVVDTLTANEAIILNRIGAPNTFRRHDPSQSTPFDMSQALPIWDAFAPENLSCR